MKRALILIVCGALSACHTTQPPVTSGTDAASSIKTAAPAASSAQRPASSSEAEGPKVEYTFGARPATRGVELTASVAAIEVVGQATFLQIAMPKALPKLVDGLLEDAHLTVLGARHGFAVPGTEGRVPDRPLAWVRLVGVAVPEGDISLELYQAALVRGEAGVRQTIRVTGASAAPKGEISARFYHAAGRWFARFGSAGLVRMEPFYAFASARMERLAHLSQPGGQRAANRLRRGEMGEMMSFYSGLTSIEEALQADRGLLLPPDVKAVRDVPLSTLKPVKLSDHPWPAMIDDLPGKPTPSVEPLASFVPSDMLYLHFHDLRTVVRLAAEIDEMVSPLALALEERPGARHFVERYERQLALERTGLAEKLGHLAAEGVALVTSDPFLREGSDVSLLFKVRNRALLETAFAGFEMRAKARRSDATVTTYTLAGETVRLFGTKDRAIHQHRLLLGDVLVVSNSRRALARLIATRAGEIKALSASGDFRYFRALYPFEKDAEDGFLFISDDFVRHVVSPRVKVLQARRMLAQAELYAVGYGALLHGWFEGTPARNTATMLKGGLVHPDELKHEDGTGSIELKGAQGPISAAWGRPWAMRPLIELELDKVTAAEAGAYARFRETYQQNWNGYIDPIGVRIRWHDTPGAHGVDLDARMLPLIGRSDYRDLERMVGRKRVAVPTLSGGLRYVVAIGEKARLRSELTEMGRMATASRKIGLDWLGDWAMVGVADQPSLWDLAQTMGEVPSAKQQKARDLNLRKQTIDAAPLYAALHVRNALSLGLTLAAVKAFVESAAPGVVEWGPDTPHGKVPVVKLRENLGREGEPRVSVYYAITQDMWLISLNRKTLEQVIDAASAENPRDEVDGATDGAQTVLELRPDPKRGWIEKTLLGMLERGNQNSMRTAFRAYEALSRGGMIAPGVDRDVALAYLGYVPGGPHGGTFSMVDGEVRHTIYGSEAAPMVPDLPVPGSPVSAFVRALDHLRLSVSFEGKGRTRALHTTLRWRRR